MKDANRIKHQQWTGISVGTRKGILGFSLMLKLIGRHACCIVLYPVALFYYLFSPKSRSGTEQYLSHRFPTASRFRKHIFRFQMVENFANMLLDKIHLSVSGPSVFNFEFPTTGKVLSALSMNMGVIILSAHVGNWEIVSRMFKHIPAKINIVVFEAERPEIKQVFDQLNQTSSESYSLIHSNDPFDAIIKIYSALRRKEIVIMHGDRFTAKYVEYPFMGENAFFPELPYHLAAKTGAPVVIAFCIRTGHVHYTAIAYEPFTLNSTDDNYIYEGLTHYVPALEQIVTKYPFQWLNYYNFWNRK